MLRIHKESIWSCELVWQLEACQEFTAEVGDKQLEISPAQELAAE
jgi:hypothetical protein